RARHLSAVVATVRAYAAKVEESARAAGAAPHLLAAAEITGDEELRRKGEEKLAEVDPELARGLAEWDSMLENYSGEEFSYEVRGREVRAPLNHVTLSGTKVPKVATPKMTSWGDRVRWLG